MSMTQERLVDRSVAGPEGLAKKVSEAHPEFPDFLKVGNQYKDLVDAFWGVRKILGIGSPADAVRRENLELPKTEVTFATPDKSLQFEETEGPSVEALIIDNEELESRGLTRRQKKDYRKFRQIIEDNSKPFWEIGDRDTDIKRQARINKEVDDYLKEHSEIIETIFIPDADMTVREFLYLYSEQELSKEIELVLPVEDTNAEKSTDVSTDVVIASRVRRFSRRMPHTNPRVSRRKKYTAVGAAVAVAGVAAADIAHVVPEKIDPIKIVSKWNDNKPARSSGEMDVVRNEVTGTTEVTIFVSSAPESTTTTSTTIVSPKIEELPKARQETKEEANIANTPWLIETVKNKKEVIAAKAKKYKIPEQFLALVVQMRTAGNSKFGDRPDSDTKGLAGVSEFLAKDEAKFISMDKYDLLKDEDNLDIAASRVSRLINKYGGLETNDQVSQIMLDFEGTKTKNSALISGIWLQRNSGDYSAFNLWAADQVSMIRAARDSQNLK